MAFNHVYQFDTRSEENGLLGHSSLNEALEHAKSDPTVWKISFFLNDANHTRIRFVRTKEGWTYEDITGGRMV